MAFKPAYSNSIHTVTLPEGASVDEAAGTPIALVAGYIVAVAETGNVIDITGGTSEGIFGVLAEPTHNTSAGVYDVKVYVITEGSEWIADTDADPTYDNMGWESQISDTFAVKMVTAVAGSEECVVPYEIYRDATDRKVLCRFINSVIQGSS